MEDVCYYFRIMTPEESNIIDPGFSPGLRMFGIKRSDPKA